MAAADDDEACPLCCEEFAALGDQNFLPCKCGYRVCMWCWHHIRNETNALCPACRTPYADDPYAFSEEAAANHKAKRDEAKALALARPPRPPQAPSLAAIKLQERQRQQAAAAAGGAAAGVPAPAQAQRQRGQQQQQGAVQAPTPAQQQQQQAHAARQQQQQQQQQPQAQQAQQGRGQAATSRKQLQNMRVVQRNLVCVPAPLTARNQSRHLP